MSEANAEVPPPRYEQRGNWKHLICDEQEWLARPAPWGIEELPEAIRGRKQNLFHSHYYGWLAEFVQCPVCRPRVQELFSENGLQSASALAISGDDRRVIRKQFQAQYLTQHHGEKCDAERIVRCVCHYECGVITASELFNNAVDALFSLAEQLDRKDEKPTRWQLREAKQRQLALELIGPNPFRPIAFSSEWRTDTAVSLAHTMYDSREFSAMPILADALQDAGCDNDTILSHCRDANQPHVRGCWVIDLVLSKQ